MPQDPDLIETSRCKDLQAGRSLEWLVTNGRGGYAMAAVNQMLTRRYHGLLVAAVDPPVRRFVLLAKLDAVVTIEGLTYELATNDYPEAVHPEGFRRLESFRRRPFHTWRWRAGEALIEQTLCMVEGEDTTVVRYRLIEGPDAVMLTVRPLCTSRHFHHLTHYRDMGPPNVQAEGSRLALHWSTDRPSWFLDHNGTFIVRPDWHYRYELALERERGYDGSQDLFTPGDVTTTLRAGDADGLVFVASTKERPWRNYAEAFAAAAARDERAVAGADTDDPLIEPLMRSTADFIVRRDDDLRSVIAGYPWFGDWGRDTFISLPGLCLVTGRFDAARRIIRAFAGHVDRGLIPNRFPPYGEAPAYDTADASLWFVHAAGRYLAYTRDRALLDDGVYSAVEAILDAHQEGTRHGIGADADGLLAAGEDGFALTWMDAKVEGRAVTPRRGKPVEINALWYNALRVGSDLAEAKGEARRASTWRRAAERVREAFNLRFWNPALSCLFDVVDAPSGDGPNGVGPRDDPTIRPNQLLAISLTHTVLDSSRWEAVVTLCRRELWTPLGLRTCSPADPSYHAHYQGGVTARDTAYHQGTVWPWLLGPFVTAYVRAFSRQQDVRSTARRFLDGLLPHLAQAGLGGVSEVCDGDAPHTPGGCPWQAWSVAEPLRALCEDIRGTHPAEVSPAERPSRVSTLP
ncbi:MAG: amylo-alpha-1,6-glucosidase [Phycisphaerae bacterium]